MDGALGNDGGARAMMRMLQRTGRCVGAGLMLVATGCVEDGEPSQDPSANRTLPEMIDNFETCVPKDLAVVVPWSGPAFDPETGELLEPLPEGHLLAAVQGWRKFDEENTMIRVEQGQEIVADLLTRPGFLGFMIVESTECDTSTSVSMWADEKSMLDFVLGPYHAEAMGMSSETLWGCAGAHWQGESFDRGATWEEVKARLIQKLRAEQR